MRTNVVTPAKLRLIQTPSSEPSELSQAGQVDADAKVDETLVETFPASDPPQRWAGPPRAA